MACRNHSLHSVNEGLERCAVKQSVHAIVCAKVFLMLMSEYGCDL